MASKAEMNERDNLLRQDIEQVELKLEAKIYQAKIDHIKWMIGLLVAQTSLLIGVMLKLRHP